MRALTIKRPWAAAISQGRKTIENRSWTPQARLIGQFIAIHAGKGIDRHELVDDMEPGPTGIIAVARIAGVVTESADPWFFGPYGWVLSDITALDRSIGCVGRLRLWRLSRWQEKALRRQLLVQGVSVD